MAVTSETKVYSWSRAVSLLVSELRDEATYDSEASSGGLVSAPRSLSQSLKFKWCGWPRRGVADTEGQAVKDELAKHSAPPFSSRKN